MGNAGPLEGIMESFVIQLGVNDGSWSEDDAYDLSENDELDGIEYL